MWNEYLGQAVEVGTFSRTNTGETGGLNDEAQDISLKHQLIRHEAAPQSLSVIEKSMGDAEDIAQYVSPPTEQMTLGSSDGTTSESAIDGLRGEMDLAFGDKSSSSFVDEGSKAPKVTDHMTEKVYHSEPENDEYTPTPPQSFSEPRNESIAIYGNAVPCDPSRVNAGSEKTNDQLEDATGVDAGTTTPSQDEIIEQPSRYSDLYSVTTKASSSHSVHNEAEAAQDGDIAQQSNSKDDGSSANALDDKAEATRDEDAATKRSSAVSDYLATTTVYEQLSRRQSQLADHHEENPGGEVDTVEQPVNQEQPRLSKDGEQGIKEGQLTRSNDAQHSGIDAEAPSGLGLTLSPMHDGNANERRLSIPRKPVSEIPKPMAPPPAPRSRPPIPATPPILSTLSSPSTQHPPTPSSERTGTGSPSQRDSSTFGTATTVSSADPTEANSMVSSEFPEVNTAESINYSNSTAATSMGIAPPLSLREQGQLELRNLQSQLAAAKARGDDKSKEAAIQKSMEVIWRTHLTPPSDGPDKPSSKARSPSLKNRASMMRLPSINSSAKNTNLGNAAGAGDVIAVTKFINDRISVNSTSEESKTPLMRAAINGHVTVMEVLRTFGADEFAVDRRGATALHLAVAANNISAVKWLLANYPPPPPPEASKHRSSIFVRATEVAKWGRSHKSLREASDAAGNKPLHVAVHTDMGGMVKTLLAGGADVEAKDNWGRTPLILAVMSGRQDSFETLIRSGAKLDAVDGEFKSALHWAASQGDIPMITGLLEKGVPQWEYDNAGNLPIHEAAEEGHLTAVEALILEPSDLSRLTRTGESLLHIACLRGHQQIAEHLCKNKISVDINHWAARAPLWNSAPRSKLLGSSLTPLHYACCLGNFGLAFLLLDNDALINASTPDGYTPLMMAVEAGSTDTVSLLHRRGAKLNASLPGSMLTALHMAARKGDIESVRELCRAGANWRAIAGSSSNPKTPAQEAELCIDKTKRQLVREYFAVVRANELAKNRVTVASGPHFGPSQTTPNPAYRAQTTLAPAQGPISYAPWAHNQDLNAATRPITQLQHSMSAPQPPHFAMQNQWAVNAASQPYMDDLMRAPIGQPQYFDPAAYETQVEESPPPYQPGSMGLNSRLAARAPVYRPKYGQ